MLLLIFSEQNSMVRTLMAILFIIAIKDFVNVISSISTAITLMALLLIFAVRVLTSAICETTL